MATDVTLMVLPSFAGGEGAGRPQIFLEQKGIWCDLSTRDPINLPQIQKAVDMTLKRFMKKIVLNQPVALWPLKTLGLKTLYEKLVPRRLHDVLQAAASTAAGDDMPVLRIHTRLHWIPWELMHDETDFLGLRFQIARLPIGPTAPDLGDDQPHTVHRIYNLLAEHLFEKNLFNRWTTTFSGLVAHPGQEIRVPSAGGPGNNYPTVEDLENAQDPDIVHITCHGGEVDREDGKVYWTLNHKHKIHENYRIKDDDVATLGQMTLFFANTRPLVFGNTCASVSAATGLDASSSESLDSGFGATFFAQGAVAFVGAVAPISDRLSVEFARQFYQRLLGAGLPIGKALWATKRHFKEVGENDPSWLFYCLYGPPETRFQIAH